MTKEAQICFPGARDSETDLVKRQKVMNNHILLVSGLAVAAFICNTAVAQSLNDFKDIQIDEMFDASLRSDPFLMHGMVDILDIQGRKYIVGVGVTTNKEADGSDAKKRLDMMKVASINAKAEIAKFLNVDVSIDTLVQKTLQTSTIKGGDEAARKVRKVDKLVKKITRERARECLPGIKRVGTWYSADGSLYYLAVAAEIPGL